MNAVKKQPPPEDAFAARPRLRGDPEAGGVAAGDDDLEPDEIGVRESPIADQPDGRRRGPPPSLGRAHPIADVGAQVLPIDLVDAAATGEPAVVRDDGE